MVICLAAAVAVAAQTAVKPAASTTKPAATAKKPVATGAASVGAVKYPPGKKADLAAKKTLFALRVQDLKVGTGTEAEPMKMYKVKYTGWRAVDGVVFDSWDQHPTPVMGDDGKPVMGDDGKPKTKAPEPASFPVGMGRMIPGFDQGFSGMRVGGIRRIFVPWQLGYGSRAIPDRGAEHPGIPAKSDLVFEVELVDLTDLPASPHPNIPQGNPPGVPGGSAAPKPSTPPTGAPPTPPPSTPPSTPQSK
jgi:peptidylprolyl isomerase